MGINSSVWSCGIKFGDVADLWWKQKTNEYEK